MSRQKKRPATLARQAGPGVTGPTHDDTRNGRRRQSAVEPVWATVNGKRRMVGEIDHDARVLRRRSKPSHKLRQPAAWAWDAEIIAQAQAAGVESIEVIEVDCDRQPVTTWRVRMDTFVRNLFVVRRGYGGQVALALSYWNGGNGREAGGVQLGLFGGKRP